MKALKPIQAGEEIFNDYGPLPRSDLLRRYGYITDNYAQYDVVEIPHELVNNVAAAANIASDARIDYLDEQGVIDSGYDITASSPFDLTESIAPELIVLIETLLLPQPEFERLARKGKLPKPDKISPRAVEFLQRLVQDRARQYPTTLEDDLAQSAPVPMSGAYASKERRYAMARAVRIGEKKILKEAERALSVLVSEGKGVSGVLKRAAEDEDADEGSGKRMRVE